MFLCVHPGGASRQDQGREDPCRSGENQGGAGQKGKCVFVFFLNTFRLDLSSWNSFDLMKHSSSCQIRFWTSSMARQRSAGKIGQCSVWLWKQEVSLCIERQCSYFSFLLFHFHRNLLWCLTGRLQPLSPFMYRYWTPHEWTDCVNEDKCILQNGVPFFKCLISGWSPAVFQPTGLFFDMTR